MSTLDCVLDQGDLFVHEPLDTRPGSHQIRLLELLPGADHADEIHCRVIHSSLEKDTEYEALSYAWGDPSITLPIWLEGRRYLVTTNLESALRHLRSAMDKRVLWVDAACINQEDAIEKSRQVRMMREIYTNAKQVLVWLGEEDNAGIALDFLTRMQDEYKKDEVYSDHWLRPFLRSDKAKWEACEALFYSRAWWKRTWILQEVIHPGNVLVYLGTLTIQFDDLCERFITWRFAKSHRWAYRQLFIHESGSADLDLDRDSLTGHGHGSLRGWFHARLLNIALGVLTGANAAKLTGPKMTLLGLTATRAELDPPSMIRQCRNLHREQERMPSLAEMLIFSQLQEASDPRDKIYALLGVASTSASRYISTDYTCSLQSTFESATRAVLEHESLNILMMVETLNRPVLTYNGVPSWIPDFTAKRDLVGFTILRLARKFKAAPRIDGPQILFTSNENPNYLVLRGVYIATVVGVFLTAVGDTPRKGETDENHEMVKLIKYEQNVKKRGSPLRTKPWPRSKRQKGRITSMNTSWGSMRTEMGDIIIVARGSGVPLVLRPWQNFYLFVGGCLLIDKQSKIGWDNFPTTLNADDPCFSSIMRGSIWEGLGKTYHKEEFLIG
jgi:hypothetical protein